MDETSHSPAARSSSSSGSASNPSAPQGLPEIDVRERGAAKDGQPQTMDRRLFMQLLVLDCGDDPQRAAAHLRERLSNTESVGCVCYEDVQQPRALGLLSFSEDPAQFVRSVRPVFADSELNGVSVRHGWTMLGRSYSSGREDDLGYWLLDRPRQTVLNPEWPWAVWYPLRRTGAFAQLSGREQGGILKEHALIGRAYGARDLAHDVRLACHGLDEADNEFVIGLVGKDLHPLSHLVQRMRSTQQTSKYIATMGPFFVGHVLWRSASSEG